MRRFHFAELPSLQLKYSNHPGKNLLLRCPSLSVSTCPVTTRDEGPPLFMSEYIDLPPYLPCHSLLLKSLAPLYSSLLCSSALLSFLNQLPFPLRPQPTDTAFPDEDSVSIHIHYGHFAPERGTDDGWTREHSGRGRGWARAEGEMEDVIPH